MIVMIEHYLVNAGAGAVAIDCNIEIRDIIWCVPSIDHSIDIRVLVQRELSKNNNIDSGFHEKKTFYKNLPIANN